MSKLTKFITGLIQLQYYSGHSQLKINSKCLMPTGQQKYCRTLPRIKGDMSKGIENPADAYTRGMSIEGFKESGWLYRPVWLKTDEL